MYVKEREKDQECSSAFIILICTSKCVLLKVPNFHEVSSSCEKSHSWKVEMFKEPQQSGSRMSVFRYHVVH